MDDILDRRRAALQYYREEYERTQHAPPTYTQDEGYGRTQHAPPTYNKDEGYDEVDTSVV